jgi:hypothetical protein
MLVKTKKIHGDFLVMDESDIKILFMLIKRSEEFSKLDFTDQKVLVWFLCHSPNKVNSWVDYLAEDYHRRTISVDGVKLLDDLKELMYPQC